MIVEKKLRVLLKDILRLLDFQSKAIKGDEFQPEAEGELGYVAVQS
jgi:hypothetical protein